MCHESNHRLPKISLRLALWPLAAYVAVYAYEFIHSFDSSGDWGELGFFLILLHVCALIQLCCASAGVALSAYAVLQRIRMKASVTALVLSVLSLAAAIAIWEFTAIII